MCSADGAIGNDQTDHRRAPRDRFKPRELLKHLGGLLVDGPVVVEVRWIDQVTWVNPESPLSNPVDQDVHV